MRFSAIIQQEGKTATGIPVPEAVVTNLGSGKRPPVVVTVNGHTYRTSIATLGGRFMISLSAENRKGAGVAAGDKVDVDVELDTSPREVEVPPDLAAALLNCEEAKKSFERLSYSHKRQHVLSIEQAKTAETRQRRILNAIKMLTKDRGKDV